MTTLILTGSVGVIPRLSPRTLPDDAAQTATNIKTSSGEVRPYRKSKLVSTPGKPLPSLSLYRAIWGVNAAWFTWPFDVNVCRFPLSSDTEARFGWTGDGEPRWAPYTLAITGSGNDYPKSFYALGIPNPVTAPGVAPSGGVGSTVSRAYCYTFFSQHGEESGPSMASAATSGKVDATWAITGMDAFPNNSYAVTAASWAAGVLTLTCANVFGLRAGDQVTNSGFAPAALNGTFTIASVGAPGFTIAMAGNPGAITDGVGTASRIAPWNTTNMTKRLYRTAGTAGGFQLVVDGLTGTTYNDTILDANILGDDLISQGWQPPPTGLKGLLVSSFGSLIGFIGNQIYASEPLQAHAWKALYTWSTDFDIVAIALSGADLAVATQANAYVGVGSDPNNFVVTKIDVPYPCLSKRSMVSDGSGALYASKHGMVYVSGGSAKVITAPWYTIDEWSALNPATMFAEVAYDRLYVGYTDNNSAQRMIMLDSPNQSLFNLDIAGYAIYQDDASGTIYIGTAAGIEEFDPLDGAPLPLEWHSKQFVLPAPINLGAAKVEFDAVIDVVTQAAQQAAHDAAVAANAAAFASGDIGGYFGGGYSGAYEFGGDALVSMPDVPAQNTVSFTLYDEDTVVYSGVVSDSKVFRLPAGYKADHFSVKVNSQCALRRVMVGETPSGLKIA